MLLKFPQKRFIRALVLIVGVLAVLSIGVNFLAYSMTAGNSVLLEVRESLQRLFDVNAEANIPTWFSSALLLACATLLAAIAAVKAKSRDG